MSFWDFLFGAAVADKKAGDAPLTGTASGLTQAEQNWYDDTYKNS